MLIPNKKELGHIFNQYSISGYISSESTFWIPRTTPASRSREVKLVAMQLPLADLTGSQIWRNGKFVLEKRTLTAKKDRVGHQHFTRILLDLFGVCYPCIYIYVCIYISQSIVKYVVSQTNFQLPVSKVPTDLGPLHCSNTICCLITTGQWSVRAASRYLKVSRIPTDLSNPKPNRTPTKQTHHGTRSQKFETCPTIQWIGLKEILQDRTL